MTDAYTILELFCIAMWVIGLIMGYLIRGASND